MLTAYYHRITSTLTHSSQGVFVSLLGHKLNLKFLKKEIHHTAKRMWMPGHDTSYVLVAHPILYA